jgi:hypothetical protein
MNQSEIQSIFDYDPLTGDLIRKSNNKVTGTLDESGYKRTKFKGISKTCHRLIWIWHNGEIPNGCVIDHIDHNRSNNRIENLQCISLQDNSIKRKPPTYDDYKVYKTKEGWVAKINMRVGLYNTEQEAIDRCDMVVTELKKNRVFMPVH